MASKILTPPATYTKATRTISGATMAPVFEAGDQQYQRQVVFWIGAGVYWGRVETYLAANSVRLAVAGTLPSADGTISGAVLLDAGEAHSYAAYYDQVVALVKDDASRSKLLPSDIDRAIARALAAFNVDKPWLVSKRVAGDGTAVYPLADILGALWVPEFSYLESVEYPAGQEPAVLLEPSDYEVYDDGTAQDGSNLALRFKGVTPGASEFFTVRARTERVLPAVGVANFPDTTDTFQAITLLAASHVCMVLAAVYAPSTDSTIQADAVNYNEKTRKYRDLARDYRNQYNLAVFGSTSTERPLSGALLDVDLDTDNSMGSRRVFHGSRQR